MVTEAERQVSEYEAEKPARRRTWKPSSYISKGVLRLTGCTQMACLLMTLRGGRIQRGLVICCGWSSWGFSHSCSLNFLSQILNLSFLIPSKSVWALRSWIYNSFVLSLLGTSYSNLLRSISRTFKGDRYTALL